mmetsp:Transcript_42218/g.100121  ORF Transcript_42218/g.100121 Transcript_42218/m.100121 type:complete len:213 (+) Transcript_42218:126-764(+)
MSAAGPTAGCELRTTGSALRVRRAPWRPSPGPAPSGGRTSKRRAAGGPLRPSPSGRRPHRETSRRAWRTGWPRVWSPRCSCGVSARREGVRIRAWSPSPPRGSRATALAETGAVARAPPPSSWPMRRLQGSLTRPWAAPTEDRSCQSSCLRRQGRSLSLPWDLTMSGRRSSLLSCSERSRRPPRRRRAALRRRPPGQPSRTSLTTHRAARRP